MMLQSFFKFPNLSDDHANRGFYRPLMASKTQDSMALLSELKEYQKYLFYTEYDWFSHRFDHDLSQPNLMKSIPTKNTTSTELINKDFDGRII